jgi:phospholipase A1
MIASRHRVRVIALLCAGIASARAFAQAPASTLADCHRIDSSADRLACYDAVSGRGGAVQKPGEATPPTAVAPDAMTQAVAKEATAQSAPSMIDAAWGFDPKSSAFDIRFHRANYLLIGRYTDRVNNAPYIPLW